MHHDEALRDKLIGLLQDAYAMENQIAEVLEKQVKDTKQYPDVRARIQEHLNATTQHRARVEGRLRAHGKQPSTVKGLLSALFGNMQGALGGTRSHELMMNARDDYVLEHFEIAMYGILLSVAQLFGDEETVSVAEENLGDEVVMAQWLQHHVTQATYLSLEQERITVPIEMWQRAQSRLDASLESAIAAWQPGPDEHTAPSVCSTVG
jgi:ferritin-like metal-binding protein YciE